RRRCLHPAHRQLLRDLTKDARARLERVLGAVAPQRRRHSARSASTGATRVAARAGTSDAASATRSSTIGAATNVIGSCAETPASIDAKSLDATAAPARPTTHPTAAVSSP